jgi:MFS family permease
LAALLIGLGYGPAPPAGNQILMNTAPDAHRGLIFSIKQSGAPIGSALAGFLLPSLADHFGWPATLAIAACLGGAAAFLVEPYRTQLDAESSRPHIASLRSFLSPRMLVAPFSAIRGAPELRFLAYCGFAFAVVQGSLFALYVTYLVTSVGVNLPEAGMAFAAMQLAGALARIATGWLADRISSPLMVLAALGIASSAAMATIGSMRLEWGWSAIFGISIFAGFCRRLERRSDV